MIASHKIVSFISIALTITFVILYYLFGGIKDLINFQLLLIGSISIYGVLISAERQIVSLSFIFWFFIFIFFFVSPSVRYKFSLFPLVSLSNSPTSAIISANYLILFWQGIFLIVGTFVNISNTKLALKVTSMKSYKTTNIFSLPYLFILFSLVLMVLAINPISLFVRGGGINHVISNNILKLFFQYFIRPLSFCFFMIYLAKKRQKALNVFAKYPFSISLLFIFVLLNFPTATARFYAFSIYLGIFFYFFKKNKMNKGYFFIPMMFVGIAASEVLNLFRNLNNLTLTNKISIDQHFWGGMGFDAYEMLVSSMLYVKEYSILYGKNILGAVFFFVPRIFWTTKPIGSGAFIMEDYYTYNNPYGKFTNVSCPLFAETFLAFGYVGTICIAVFTALLINSLDRGYRETQLNSLNSISHKIFSIFYFTSIGFFFFMMRGDLMSSFAYFMGFWVSYILALKFHRIEIAFIFEKKK